MKKITFLIVFLTTLSWQGQAQTYVQENFNTGMPVTWTIVDGGAATGDSWISGMQGAGNSLDGSNSAIVDSDANGNGTLLMETMVTPVFNSSAATTLFLDFDQYYNAIGGDSAIVEVFDGTSWVPVLVQNGTDMGAFNTPDQQHIDITAYKNANMQVRFYYNDNNVWAWYWLVDNVLIYNSTCPQPSALSASNILGTSADLTWTETGTATSWEIEWGVGGFTPGSGTSLFTTTNPHSLTGLTSSTSYDFYVRSVCGAGDSSIWVGPYNFVTACATSMAPWTDNIEAHTPTTLGLSNCWNATSTSGYDWNIDGAGSTPSTGTGPNAANSGVNYFYIEASSGTAGDVAELYSPNVDLTALTVPALEFYYHMTGSAMGDLYVDVFDGTWNNVDVIMGQQQAAQADPWLKRTIDLSAYSGIVQIRFRAISAGTFAGDISLDDIGIVEGPSCFDPTMLTASNILDISANLAWTNNGSATTWEIEWGTTGFIQGAGTSVITTTNPHNLTGLSAVTAYDYYVRSVCGAGDSSLWAGPYTFTTACATKIAPWIDSVETHTPTTTFASSNCWSATSTSAYDWNIDGAGSTPSSNTGPSGAFSGTNYFYIEASSGASGNIAELYSPNVDLSALTIPAVEFYYHMFGSDMGNLYIDVFNGSVWVNNVDSIIGQQQTAQIDPWLMKSVALTSFSGIVQVRFRAISAGTFEGDISLDDIEFKESSLITCVAPNNLVVSNVSNNTVDLGWTEFLSATTWEIEWDTAGFVQGTGNTVITTTNPHNLTGLTVNTSYDFYVRAICGAADTSSWSMVGTFNTLNVGINETANNINLSLYPNPTTGLFTLNVNTTDANTLEIKIVNLQGQVVFVKNNFDNVSNVSEQIDLSDNAKGIYFLSVVTEKGIKTHKIVVR